MYCEKYSCSMSEAACVSRQKRVGRGWMPGEEMTITDPGCVDCEQGRLIMEKHEGGGVAPDKPGHDSVVPGHDQKKTPGSEGAGKPMCGVCGEREAKLKGRCERCYQIWRRALKKAGKWPVPKTPKWRADELDKPAVPVPPPPAGMMHGKENHASIIPVPREPKILRPVEEDEPESAADPQRNFLCIDFKGRGELMALLRQAADEDERTAEGQAVYYIKQALARRGKNSIFDFIQ